MSSTAASRVYDRNDDKLSGLVTTCDVIPGDDVAPITPFVRIVPAARSRFRRSSEAGCLGQLDFANVDHGFAAALTAELRRSRGTPAAGEASSHALNDLAFRVGARSVTVLINGPTGTGKEVLARAIHQASPRRDLPLIAVNCAALPEAMLEALLFGHERGAFTGAQGASPGLFRAAHRSTLLLDEVAELPLGCQAKLLRVLQEREVLAIGATVPASVDVRVIATANRDLAAEIAAGRFRSDLYYRLAVFPLTTMALRHRPADLLPLVAALLLRLGNGIPAWPEVEALDKLAAHDWPGNVRELGNVLERALIYGDGERITARDIVFDIAAPVSNVTTLRPQVRDCEFDTIRRTLEACAGRRIEAARRLGISERSLRYKLAAMALPAAATIQ